MPETSTQLSVASKEVSTSHASITTQTIYLSTTEAMLSSASSTLPNVGYTTELTTEAVTSTRTEKTSTLSTALPTHLPTVSSTLSSPMTNTMHTKQFSTEDKITSSASTKARTDNISKTYFSTLAPESVVTQESSVTHVSVNTSSSNITSSTQKPSLSKSTSPVSESYSNTTKFYTENKLPITSTNEHLNISENVSTVKPPLNYTTAKTSPSHGLSNTTAIVTSIGKSTISTTPSTSFSPPQEPCIGTENQQCSYINGICTCVCSRYYIGSSCEYGKNETSAVLNSGGPIRNISVEITINKAYTEGLKNTSSVDYIILYKQIINVLETAFRRASPNYFSKVVINGFRRGSIIVDSTAIYTYPNNQTGIDFINNNLNKSVNTFLNESLPELTRIMNTTVSITRIQPEPPAITMVDELKNYVTCSLNYAGYIVTCNNIHCYCTGPCFNTPDYCNYHGDCYNAANGSICMCYKHEFYQYQGKQCELYEQTSGFYGLIFGVIGGALLLLIVLIFAICILRKKRMFSLFSERAESKMWFTYDEERTNFQNTDMDAFARASMRSLSPTSGKYDFETNSFSSSGSDLSAGVYRPRLDKVDTSQTFKIQRPEMIPTYEEQR
ncbi:hypothetical protein GDO81_014131 [Engystomops pustulosus]|uniref:SEA domain-containing protein n=2 Tax=Engystomops pustulosus TaxID=76066 RepID=A0AAV7B8D4_ENGPU|nr:hypothetical protein GDO81_014131 [Engystomops pustulosus]